jgi:Fibronectin type III domain
VASSRAKGGFLRAKLILLGILGLSLAGIGAAGSAQATGGCRPLRVVIYAATGSTAVAQALAADASPCAEYYVTVPPLAADKTEMRSGVAPGIRALGSSFHALAEVNVTAWQGWVTSTGDSWYQAGVEARTRMTAAGFDVAAGDSWALNELSSAVRTGAGQARQNMRDFAHGLYDGDGSEPAAKGVVFVSGIGQPTTSLSTYQANLESWLQDSGFWGDMGSYVGDFLQEDYGDIRDYGVAGADVPTRLTYLNQYLEHVLALASASSATDAAAQSYLAGSYAPLANAAWAWSSSFGFTAVPYDQMEDYVSAQVDAMRSYEASLGWSGDRIGFAWDPSNSLGLSSGDFASEQASLLSRLAAAIVASADPSDPGAGACSSPWCTADVTGAAFNPAWGRFSTWEPTGPAFGTTPLTVTAGTASGSITLESEIGGIATTLPVDTDVELSSSSSGGSFSTSPSGPWSPTLDATIPGGSGQTTVYMLDSDPGNPTVTAAVGSQTATQIEIVTAPAAPLSLGDGGNTVTFAEGGPPVAVDPSLTVGDSESTTVVSASVTLSAGAVSGDTLAASTTGTAISASYSGGTLTLSGTDTLADYQAVLRSVTFSGTTTAGGARTVVWTADDGTTSASAVSTVSYTAPPSAPTGAAADAGDGQASVSFDAPASDGGSTVTSYTVTSSPGGLTASGSSSPITVTGLTDGVDYTFTVTAANAAGTGPASAASNIVTPTAAGGGAGGGGGGGGGGGSSGAPPNLDVTIAPTVTGSNVSLRWLVGNKGGVAFTTVLTVTTSGLSGVGSVTLWGFGAGCTSSGTTTTCALSSLPTGDPVAVAVVNGTMTGSSASATATLGQTNLGDTDPSDDTASWSYSVPSSAGAPSPAPQPSSRRKNAAKTVELVVKPNPHGTVVLRPKPGSRRSMYALHSTVRATVELRRGYVFARWIGSACKGTRPVCVVSNLTASKWLGFDAKRARKP